MISHAPIDAIPTPAMIIGDGRIEQGSGGTHTHIYAATGQPTREIPLAGMAEVDRAVAAARSAIPLWAGMPVNQRRDMLLRLAELLRRDASLLTTLSVIDNSVPISTAQYGPHVAADAFTYNAGWTDKIGGDVISTWPAPAFDYTLDEPYGVVAVIIPWNGPIYALGMVLAPALAAGNTIVVKPPELAPFAAQRFGELCLEAGLPAGTVNIVPGGPEAGHALTSHPSVNKIHFTGSGATARHILAAAARHVTPVALELGGKSAMIVFDDADLDAFTPFALSGIVNNTGQGCVNATRLLVHRSVYARVVEQAAASARGVPIGDPFSPTSAMGPVVDHRAVDRICGMIARGQEKGARLIAGGERLGGDFADGFFIPATVFADVAPDAELSQKEVFGPVLAITPFDTDEEAVRLANNTEFGLGAYLWTRDLKRAHLTSRQLVSGTVWINGFSGLPNSAPFGGVGESGHGRLGGIHGIREFLRPKNVWIGL